MSQKQNYDNHIRYYPPHHFVFYPVMLFLLGFTSYKAYTDETLREIWIMATIIFAVITWLAYMLRQHYALSLQNSWCWPNCGTATLQ